MSEKKNLEHARPIRQFEIESDKRSLKQKSRYDFSCSTVDKRNKPLYNQRILQRPRLVQWVKDTIPFRKLSECTQSMRK